MELALFKLALFKLTYDSSLIILIALLKSLHIRQVVMIRSLTVTIIVELAFLWNSDATAKSSAPTEGMKSDAAFCLLRWKHLKYLLLLVIVIICYVLTYCIVNLFILLLKLLSFIRFMIYELNSNTFTCQFVLFLTLDGTM